MEYILLLLLAVSCADCYPLFAQNTYNQGLVQSHPWNVRPHHYPHYNHYDPFLPNPDYYLDNYPNYDSNDMYPEVFYYVPANRRTPYYEQPIIEAIDKPQDYEEDYEKPLKNELTNDIEYDYEPIEMEPESTQHKFDNRIVAVKSPFKSPEKQLNRKVYKNRYEGFDGFGRKREKDQVFGKLKILSKELPERPKIYGTPVQPEHRDDQEVKELKSLLLEPIDPETETPPATDSYYNNPDLIRWISGEQKRSGDRKNRAIKMAPSKKAGKQRTDEMEDKYTNEVGDYRYSKPSVYDKIKEMLNMEDLMNERLIAENMRKEKLETAERIGGSQNRTEELKITTTETPNAMANEKDKEMSYKKMYGPINSKIRSIVSYDDHLTRELTALQQ